MVAWRGVYNENANYLETIWLLSKNSNRQNKLHTPKNTYKVSETKMSNLCGIERQQFILKLIQLFEFTIGKTIRNGRVIETDN